MPTDRPPKVSLNLDKLEREGDRREPFTVAAGAGRPIVFADPMEIPWDDLIDLMSNPARFLDVALPDDDARRRITADLPAWKMRQLSVAYLEHYGLAGPGEVPASPA